MKETLCWSCTKPGTGRCSWDRELEPVKGWTAVPSQTDGFDTFRVLHCPQYQKEPPRMSAEAMAKIRRDRGIDTTAKHYITLTDELLEEYDRRGVSLVEIAALTGLKTSDIYQRRQKLRRGTCGED